MIRILAGVCLGSIAYVTIAQAQPDTEPPLKLLTGVVEKVDGKSLSLKPRTKKSPEVFYRFAKDLRILLQTDENIDLGGGKLSPKNTMGKITDVKVGQRVTIAFRPDLELVEIVVLRDKSAKKS